MAHFLNAPDPAALEAGPELLRLVRAKFTLQGTSLNRYCHDHGYLRQSVEKALVGDWRGPMASRLRDRIIAAAFSQSA